MELLLEVMDGLAAATSADAVARAITSKGIAALGASYGGIWLLDRERNELRLGGVTALPRGSVDRWTVVPLEVDGPLPFAVRHDEPLFIDSLADYKARFPESFERIQETISSDDVTYAMVPFGEDGVVLGALALTYDRGCALTAGDRTFLKIIARQCALAIRRIAAHDAERVARFEAEEATRAREEILSVVSHDLRNPLGTILLGVSTLQQLIAGSDQRTDRMRTIAERIERQSERMARLLEDLVDFAGIQAGKLSIERRPTEPQFVANACAELFASLAQERGIGFAVELAPDLPSIDIDPERAVQVMANLLANALKVSTKAGKVTIGAVGGPEEVVFFVRDSGPGIEADELPRLFERYWRSKKASYKGAGLGLSIARGIVDAHDGRIWAESRVGAGTAFFFTLTPRRRA